MTRDGREVLNPLWGMMTSFGGDCLREQCNEEQTKGNSPCLPRKNPPSLLYGPAPRPLLAHNRHTQTLLRHLPTWLPHQLSPSRAPGEQALIDGWQQRSQTIPQVAVRETASGREVGSSTGDHALWAARLAHVLKTDDPELLVHLVRQVASCVWKTETEEAMNLTIAAVAGIGPRDQLEALLAVQMVGVHNVAMELLRRTMFPDQSMDGVTVGVQRATALLRTFTTQMETLTALSRRGKTGCDCSTCSD